MAEEEMEVDVDAALAKADSSAMETDHPQPHKSSAPAEGSKKEFKENKDGIKRDGSFNNKKSIKKSFRGLLDSRKKAKDLAGNTGQNSSQNTCKA